MSRALKIYVLSLLVSVLLSASAYGMGAFENEPVLKFYSGYNDLGCFNDGLAPVKDDNGKLGYINLEGQLVIDFQFDTERTDFELDGDFSNVTYYDPVTGITKTSWSPVVRMYDPRVNNSFIPSESYCFDRCFAYVVKNGKNIYIDQNGNELVNPFPNKYHSVAPYYNGRALAQKAEGGLFGYIDESGEEITGFKYLNASHFKGGVALAVEPVPFKNGSSRYIPEYLASDVTNAEIDDVCPIRNKNIPNGMDIIDVYLDTEGNVLSWKFHDEKKLDNDFRGGQVISMEDVSEGLILCRDFDTLSELPQFWYELPDGSVSIKLDPALNIIHAASFNTDKIAPVTYMHSGEERRGYIDNKGSLISNEELKERFPSIFTDLRWVHIDKNGRGWDEDVVTKDGRKFLMKVEGRNIDNPETLDINTMSTKFFLLDEDRIIADLTEQTLEGLARIYCDFWSGSNISDVKADIEKGDPFSVGINIYKVAANSNIYYVSLRKSIRELECTGYIVVDAG